jgi:hypothetical protein
MQFAILSAMILAAGGALFGATTARLFWADDLKHAQKIDAIRSETEKHLRCQIKALEDQLAIYRH